jgi:Family of unknown function (DUF6308)
MRADSALGTPWVAGLLAPDACTARGLPHRVHVVTLTIAGRSLDPADIWRQYARRTRTLHGYDLAGTGDQASLTRAEVARSRIIASRISNDECGRLLRRSQSAPWASVSMDMDLAQADPVRRGGPFDNAAALYWHFTTPHERGIGMAKIHKVLHLKRPQLYPVLDRLVRRLYSAQASVWVDVIPGARREDAVTFWAAIRADLIDEDNRAALEVYRESLRVTRETAAMANLPAVRLLDIAAWEIARREFN